MEMLYIPPVSGCKRTCSDCCGPVPFSEAEFNRLPRKFRRLSPSKSAGKLICRFSSPEGCMIYQYRPVICRLYGAVDVPILTCPHGAKAETPLSGGEASAIIKGNGGIAFRGLTT